MPQTLTTLPKQKSYDSRVPRMQDETAPLPFASWTPLWSRLNQEAQAAVSHSYIEAMRSGYNAVSPFYLLDGLLQAPDPALERVLIASGADRNTVRAALVDLLTIGPGFDASAEMRLDDDTLIVFGAAHEAARTMGVAHVGKTHLLLAMLEGNSSAKEFLHAQGIAYGPFLKAYVHDAKKRFVSSTPSRLMTVAIAGQLFLLLLALGLFICLLQTVIHMIAQMTR